MIAAMNTMMMRMGNNDPSLFEDGDNRKESEGKKRTKKSKEMP